MVDEFGAVLGTRDPDTLVVEGNLAVVYVGLQRFDQGLDLLSRNVESRRLVLGDTIRRPCGAATRSLPLTRCPSACRRRCARS